MTMHSSKGLEFPLVAIPGIGFMPGTQKDLAAEAKLLYVAMTRSTEKLVLTCHEKSEFVQMLAEVC
jgi:superfamily I DNA/RNA helicase